jgi:hypothetical protein
VAAALHPVFLVATGVCVLAFALAWLLPDVPLRAGTRASDAAVSPGDERPATEAA